MARSTRLVILVKNIYALWGRKRFRLPVTYFPTNLVYPFTLRVTGIITYFNSELFVPKPGALQFGVSPLPAWIRFLEFVLNISYKIELKKWHIKGEDKIKLGKRKNMFKKSFGTKWVFG